MNPKLLARLTDTPPPPVPLRVVCAWCPDFNPSAESNRGATHGICPACEARVDAEIAAKDHHLLPDAA